jgi:IS30 family transposase
MLIYWGFREYFAPLAELARQLGCCSRTAERELDRCASARYSATAQDRMGSAMRRAQRETWW